MNLADRNERILALWDDGMSAGQIAKLMGGSVTRSAAIGVVSRNGRKGRGSNSGNGKSPKPPKKRDKPPRVRISQPIPEISDVELAEIEANPVRLDDGSFVTILTVTSRMCRWPIGDPGAPDFHLCGHTRKDNLPYCEAHCRRAYQPNVEKDKS